MHVNFALLFFFLQYTLEDYVVKFMFHELLECLLYVSINILTFVTYVIFNTTRTMVFVLISIVVFLMDVELYI